MESQGPASVHKNAEKGDPCALLVGVPIGVATVVNIMEVLQKTKKGTT